MAPILIDAQTLKSELSDPQLRILEFTVYLARKMCGHQDVAVYDGSMIESAMDPKLPLKLGTLP